MNFCMSFVLWCVCVAQGGSALFSYIPQEHSRLEGEYVNSTGPNGDEKYRPIMRKVDGVHEKNPYIMCASSGDKALMLPTFEYMQESVKDLSQWTRELPNVQACQIMRGACTFLPACDYSETMPLTIQNLAGQTLAKNVIEYDEEALARALRAKKDFCFQDDTVDAAGTLARFIKVIQDAATDYNYKPKIYIATTILKRGRKEGIRVNYKGQSFKPEIEVRGSLHYRLSIQLAALALQDFDDEIPMTDEGVYEFMMSEKVQSYVQSKYLLSVQFDQVKSTISVEHLLKKGYMTEHESKNVWVFFDSTTINPHYMSSKTWEELSTILEKSKNENRIVLIPMIANYAKNDFCFLPAILSNCCEEQGKINPTLCQSPIFVIRPDGAVDNLMSHVKGLSKKSAYTILGMKGLTDDPKIWAQLEKLKGEYNVELHSSALSFSTADKPLPPQMTGRKIDLETISFWKNGPDQATPLVKVE